MNNIRCPICNRNVSLYRTEPFTAGILNPYRYDFHCEYCTYKIGGQDYLRFFGVCHADKEIKYFILRYPLQGKEEVLMMEAHQDSHSVRFFRSDRSEMLLEEKTTISPKEGHNKLTRLIQLIAFT